MIKKTLIVLLLSLYFPVLRAQDWKADIEKAYTVFSSDNLELEVEHVFYPSVNAMVPVERQTIRMLKMGDNYHINQYGMEIIRNSRYTVFVNEPARVIGISDTELKMPEEKQAESSKQIGAMLDVMKEYIKTLDMDTTSVEDNYSTKYLGVSGGYKKYRFDYKEGQILYSIVYLSAHTGLLDKISVVFREPVEVEPGKFQQMRLELLYRKQDINKKFSEEMFSIDSIVRISSQGEAIPTEKYKDYRVLNNIVK
jgi:hypothetical protein